MSEILLTRRDFLAITGGLILEVALGSSCSQAPEPGPILAPEQTKELPVSVIVSPDEALNRNDIYTLRSSAIPEKSSEMTEEIGRVGFRLHRTEDDKFVYQPAVTLEPGIEERLEKPVHTINGILSGDQMKGIEVYPYNFSSLAILGDSREEFIGNLNGHPSLAKRYIEIELRPDFPLAFQEIEMLTFHEMMHVFQDQTPLQNFGWSDSVYNGYWSQLNSHKKKLLNQNIEEMKVMGVSGDEIRSYVGKILGTNGGEKLLGSLFNIFTESSYGLNGGHPYDNPGELFASSSAILRYFPRSFILTVEALPIEYKPLVISVARRTLGVIDENATDKDLARDLFSGDLHDYLEAA